MKSLAKISRRYVLYAILLTMFVLYINAGVFVIIGVRYMDPKEQNEIRRETMESINQELTLEDGISSMSQDGINLLKESSFAWAMYLDESGDVQWSWQLPENLPSHYSIGDVSSFSRWYLNDYPVRTWKKDSGLMVYGMEKNSIIRYDLIYDREMLEEIPNIFLCLLLVNVLLIFLLALFFAYRFYRSVRPVGEGIELLAEKKVVHIPEKGAIGELAGKLNQMSKILSEQDEALNRRDMARTEWIAGVSHDIRTPLALITGYADELSREPEISKKGKEKAKQIQNLGMEIGQLIADLNLTSKLEYQAQPLSKTSFSPAELLRNCIAEYYNQGLSDAYTLEVDITPDAERIRLMGDTRLLLRAFRNLIGNSIRHNPQGCNVNVRLTDSEGGAAFLFSDSGAGIPALIADTLTLGTDSFTADTQPVHIMGLRIVKQIIEAHGGSFFFVQRTGNTYDVKLVLKHSPE